MLNFKSFSSEQKLFMNITLICLMLIFFIFIIVTILFDAKLGLFSLSISISSIIFVLHLIRAVTAEPINKDTNSQVVTYFSYFLDIEIFQFRMFYMIILLALVNVAVWHFLDINIAVEDEQTKPLLIPIVDFTQNE